MTTPKADVTLVTDPRFMGGTASAFLADITALSRAGLRLGLRLVRSRGFFQPEDPDNPALTALAERSDIIIDPDSSNCLFLHNPQVFGHAQAGHLPVGAFGRCDRLFMVAHHPPFLGDGALCYDPLSTTRSAERLVVRGVRAEWLPVSGLVRAQLRSFQPFLLLSEEDWVNTFDTAEWQPQRPKLDGGSLVIGRHGRANADKWPDDPRAIAASLPVGPQVRVHVLGAEAKAFEALGVTHDAWRIDPFGSLSPRAYLDGLDVFSYFYSARWAEAFGRTIAEAMLMGVRCILDPRLEQTFGPHAIYCQPADVAKVLNEIRQSPDLHRDAAAAAQEWARATLDLATVIPRLARLRATPPSRRGMAPRAVPPLTTLRKLVGFHRRSMTSNVPSEGA